MTTPIIERKEGFFQVCVLQGTLICEQGQEPTPADIDSFQEFFASEFSVQIQYLEQVTTLPDLSEFGQQVPGTGGRNDVLFAVHQDDVGKFAVPRFSIGARWIEDVLAPTNHGRHLYDCERLDQYKTW